MITRLNCRSLLNGVKVSRLHNKWIKASTFDCIKPSNYHVYSTIKITYSFVNIPTQSKYHQAQLPQKINQVLQLIELQKNFNQKSILLQYFTEIVINDPKIILSRDQRARIAKQLKLWSGRKGRSDKVATIVWVIRKLNFQKQLEYLVNQITQRFQNDQWYVNFDQSLKALEAFTDLRNEEIKNYIYPRIQRNISITVWEFNMTVYQRIVVALLEGGRMQSELWDKLQDHIMKNLGMEYSLKTITDIFTCYALARRGSDIFFQMIQKAIFLGHWYSYELKHKLLPGYDQAGEFYALLVETYSQVKQNCDIYLLPNFLQYIYEGVADRKTNYQHLSSFTKIIQHLPGLFEEQDQDQIISNLLQNKKPTSITYKQIIQFHDLMHKKQRIVPLNLHRHIEKVLLSDIRKKLIPPSKVLQISEELLQKDYVLDKQQLFAAIDESISATYKYLEGQQARAVLQLSLSSNYLPENIKKTLALPGKILKKQE